MHQNHRNEIVDAESVMKQIWDYIKSGKSSESTGKSSVSGIPQREFDFSELEYNKAMVNRVWHIQFEKLITSQRKLIGKLIVFGKKVIRKFCRWYIAPLFKQQVNFNGAVTRCLNEFYNFTRFIEGKNKADLLELESRLKAELEFCLKTEQQKLSELNWRIRRLERQTRQSKIVQANGESKQPAGQTGNFPEAPRELDYFLFEQRFRGTVEDIKNRQRIYVDFFQGKTNVLDIGCGRGELVELLLEQGVPAHGIDLNEDMVDYCKGRGLPVEKSDAVAYLKTLPDGSLEGVYIGQVVEHLSTNYLLQLVELIYTKLKVGSYLIIETPNPLTLGIFSSFFYQDLTHQKPVHPITLEFILQGLGFLDIKIEFQSPVPDELKLKLISYSRENDANPEVVNTFNDNIGILNNLLFGYQDYAIIAHK